MLEATLCGLLWLMGFWMFWRGTSLPKSTSRHKDAWSVIIPARNEAQRLPPLLESLQTQTLRPLEIWVIDDHSTDPTAEIARRGGARVLTSAALPAGWRGKTWACQQGAQAAQGARLLFLDADVRLGRHALERISSALPTSGGAVSVLPFHRTVRWVEDLSGLFNLVQAAASNAFTPLGRRDKAERLFGPVLAISREDFWAVGGYEEVKDRWVENFDLSEILRARGIACTCYIGQGAVESRMYDGGIADIAAGWAKSFALGSQGTSLSIWIVFSLWLSGSFAAAWALIVALLTFDPPLLACMATAYSLYAFQTGLWLRRLGSFRRTSAFLYPILGLFFVAVFFRSLLALLLGRSLLWKGRRNI